MSKIYPINKNTIYRRNTSSVGEFVLPIFECPPNYGAKVTFEQFNLFANQGTASNTSVRWYLELDGRNLIAAGNTGVGNQVAVWTISSGGSDPQNLMSLSGGRIAPFRGSVFDGTVSLTIADIDQPEGFGNSLTLPTEFDPPNPLWMGKAARLALRLDVVTASVNFYMPVSIVGFAELMEM